MKISFSNNPHSDKKLFYVSILGNVNAQVLI